MAAGHDTERAAAGSFYALGAFVTWGVAPVYFHAIATVPPTEVIAHRIAWSAVFLLAIAALTSRMGAVLAVLRRPRVLLALAGTAVLIGINWLVFVWAIGTQQVLQVSLGYFMNPLVNVALGAALLRERLSRAQAVAVTLAAGSVVFLVVSLRAVPLTAVVLASSFALYGLFRKLLPVDPLTGLLIETLALWPVAAGWLGWLHARGAGTLGAVDLSTDVLLLLSGAWTALPLLCFVAAAKRLTLTALGFFQYIAPSLQFLLAIFLWHEPFDARRLVAFCGIWAALAIVSADAVARARTSARRHAQGEGAIRR